MLLVLGYNTADEVLQQLTDAVPGVEHLDRG